MNLTTLLKKEARGDLLTTPHAATPQGPKVRAHWPYNRKHAPSSCMISNVHDMARWAIANVNGGIYGENRILKEASYNLLWKPGSNVTDEVGLSWFLGEMEGFQTVSHEGGDDGFRSYIVLVPDQNFGIVMAFNGEGAPMGKIISLALKVGF